MLRELHLENRFRPLSMKTVVSALARPLVLFASAMLLARVQPLPGLAPLAMAAFAAALALGMCPTAVLLGCLTGAFAQGALRLTVPVGAAMVLAGHSVLQMVRGWLQHRRSPIKSPMYNPGETAVSVLAGLGVLVPGLALAPGGARQSAVMIASTAAAAAVAPFWMALLPVRLSRRHLMPEERVGLILFLLAALAGLSALWPPLALTLGYAGTLILAPMGAGAAACAGLAAAGALIFAGMEPARGAMLGLCAMLAGLAPVRRRWTQPCVLCAAAPAAAVLLKISYMDVLCALAAGGLYLALPEGFAVRARTWLAGERLATCDPDRLASRLRAESERKLRALSDAFGELSDGYRIGVDVPDEQSLIADMRFRLCEGCSSYAQCWVDGDNRAVRFLCQLISQSIDWAAGDHSEPLFGDELPPDLLRQCRRGRSIPARLGILLEEFAVKRRTEMKRSAVNQLISAQFMQAQLLLRGLADAQARPLKVRGRQAVRARAALDRAGIELSDVMALRGDRRMEICAVLKRGRWTPELAARASAQLSRVFGRPYAPVSAPGGGEIKFLRQSRYRATAAAASRSGMDRMPCGDSHMIRELDGDRILLMISDGMGSGEAAARESAQTLRLLSQFLAADVDRALALETVNELMLARTDSDMFATVDLCLIDLASGVAEFTKLAACRSLILRDGEVFFVEGGRLPLGILERVQPSVSRIQLRPGDLILLASDGVIDNLEPAVLTQFLLDHSHHPPQILAADLIAHAASAAAHPDDMTALCVRLVERRGDFAGESAGPTAKCCRAG